MTLTSRDRKLLVAIVPLMILLGYWFLLLSPKRQEAAKLGDQVAQQEQKRDELKIKAAELGNARKDFSADYAAMVELGKAIPTSVDMPSLLVQLDRAAIGTGIRFDSVRAGQRTPAAGSASSGASPSGGSGTPAAAAGGEKAGTGPGTATEQANETKQSEDARSGAASKGSAPAAGSSPSPAGAGAGAAPAAPGLDTVPLEFTFKGGFFDLADFFHRMKRFVRVANDRIAVRGRLMTINGFTFKASAFPRLDAQVFATVYLAPKNQGTTAQASPSGPAPGTGQTGSASSPSPSPSGPPAAVGGADR
jgi:Type II secretion system (T2SS), protein M